MRKEGDTCAQCMHFFRIEFKDKEAPEAGQCRRHVPTVGYVVIPVLNIGSGRLEPKIERASGFPTVMAEVWCGEFEPRIFAEGAKR